MIKTVATLLLTLGAPNAEQAPVSIEELKNRYLVCEQRAQSGRLPDTEAIACSATYEELKLRAFGGDFGLLRRWFEDARGISAANVQATRP